MAVAMDVTATNLDDVTKNSGEKSSDSEMSIMDESESDLSYSNPLMIEAVLEILFGKLDEKTLRKCRAVCRLWLKEADRIILARKEIKISTDEELATFLAKLKTSPNTVVSICIGGMKVGKYISLDTPIWTQVLQFVKPTLKTLVMDGVIMSYRAYCNMIRFIGPTLEKLEMGTLKTGDKTYYRYFPITISEDSLIPLEFPNMKSLEFLSFNDESTEATKLSLLIPHFPNLKTLIAQNIYPEKPEKFKSLRLEHLEQLEIRLIPYNEVGAMIPPDVIDLLGRRQRYMTEGGLSDGHLKCFINMNLNKIKKFSIINVNPNLSEEVLRKFLDSIKNTLEELKLINFNIFCQPTTTVIPTPFPMDFPSLYSATIHRPFIRNFGAVLRSMPKLNELELKFPMEEGVDLWGRILPAKLPEFNGLQVLDLNAYISPKHFLALAKSFTGLTSLKISPCDDDLLRLIICEMKVLEHLIIEDGENLTDEGFTGIPAQVLRHYAAGQMKGIRISKLRVVPFIGDMKSLKTLTIDGESRLTHKALNFGIAGMKNLLYVSMKGLEKARKKTMRKMSKNGFRNFGTSAFNNNMFYFARGDILSIVMSFRYTAFGKYFLDSAWDSPTDEKALNDYAKSRLGLHLSWDSSSDDSDGQADDEWVELN